MSIYYDERNKEIMRSGDGMQKIVQLVRSHNAPRWRPGEHSIEEVNRPDIITIVIDEEEARFELRRPLHMKVNGATYRLDSAIVRDVTGAHFSCLLTISGKYFAFDGESFSKLSHFNWPHVMNKNQNWSFEGSKWGDDDATHVRKKGSQIIWNFSNSYQELFYYRVQ